MWLFLVLHLVVYYCSIFLSFIAAKLYKTIISYIKKINQQMVWPNTTTRKHPNIKCSKQNHLGTLQSFHHGYNGLYSLVMLFDILMFGFLAREPIVLGGFDWINPRYQQGSEIYSPLLDPILAKEVKDSSLTILAQFY